MRNSDHLPLILGSGSPRRLELVSRFFSQEQIQVRVPDVDESTLMRQGDLSVEVLSRELARIKMDALHDQYDLPKRYLALTADTLVSMGDHVLGKPEGPENARRMLEILSGQRHQVITGVCLELATGSSRVRLLDDEVTDVEFSLLDSKQINWYVASEEPLDKAGAYGIQGLGSALVSRINGCYYNVMGLPVNKLLRMIQQISDEISDQIPSSQILPWF